METTATEVNGGYVLNGTKSWCVLAACACTVCHGAIGQ